MANTDTLSGGGLEPRSVRESTAWQPTLGRPLWLYVRVNTDVDEKFYQLTESTGAGVVPYFRCPVTLTQWTQMRTAAY